MENRNYIHILKVKKIDIAIIIAIVICGVCIHIRNLYGFDWSDETLYPVGSYRLLLGDKLFEDIYSTGQFGSALLLPIVGVYKAVAGDLSGIMLFFREMHNAINIFISFYCYYVFRKISNKMVLVSACLSIIIFAPFCVGSLSYNALSLQFLMLSGLFVAGYIYGEKFNKVKLVLSGMFYGFAAQMYPGIVFAIFVIPIYLIYKKDKYDVKEKRCARIGLWILGGSIVVILFLCILMYNSSVEAMINNFYKLFDMGDAVGYENRDIRGINSIILICLQILYGIKSIIGYNVYLVLIFTLISFLFFFCRKKIEMKLWVLIEVVWMLISLLILVSVLKIDYININYINLPFALMGPALWLISGCKNNICVMMYVLGLFECFAIQTGSNNGITGSSYGLFICSIAVIIYVSLYSRLFDTLGGARKKIVKGINKTYIIRSMVSIVTCFILVCSYFFVRVDYVYRDKDIPELNSRLESGPGKGIYTTYESKMKYEGICAEIKKYSYDSGYILFSSTLPFGYLLTELRPGTLSTFRAKISSENVGRYYEIYPEKIPDCVFVVNEDIGIENNEENFIGGHFGALLLSGNYKILELDYSTVYLKK